MRMDKRTIGSEQANEGQLENDDKHQAIRTAGTFQVEEQSNATWDVLQALQNPDYWKDMMMPG